MFIMITGGSGSGKSEYAEGVLMQYSSEHNRYYLATMQPYGEEGKKRIDRHRKMREGKGFITVEQYTDIDHAKIPKNADILLECMSNLVANELFDENGCLTEQKKQHIMDGMDRLRLFCGNLVVVTNDVSLDGTCYEESTMEYIRCLNDINIRMAAQADLVIEAASGIPVFWKKEKERNVRENMTGSNDRVRNGEQSRLQESAQEKGEHGMDIIIGGYHQGKTEYAKKRYGFCEEDIKDGADLVEPDMEGRVCLLHFHLLIRNLLMRGICVEDYLNQLLEENKISVITADEVGSGIVPADAFERRYREEVGRATCRLAGRADYVIRVLYGIGQVIKGTGK